MASANLDRIPSPSSRNKRHLADEILLNIFSHFTLPPANIIGRERYEVINVPKGPIIREGPIKSFADNNLHTGACTHQHEEWKAKLQTLSAIAQASRQFQQVALPLLYRIYPGQTIVKPQLFIRSLKEHPDCMAFVKEMVLDPWDLFNTPKEFTKDSKHLMLRSPGFATVDLLEETADTWKDAAHAIILLFYCSNIQALDLTCPSGYSDEAAISSLFTQLRRLGPNTLARSPEEAEKKSRILTDLPLRKLKNLSIHHAENHYVRNLDGLAPLMRLLTLRSITIHRFWSGADAIKNLGHIHELTLWRCSLEPPKLLKALRRCKELRSLTIIFAGFTSMLGKLVPLKEHLDFKELGDAIRTKLTKLRKLRLDDREVDVLLPSRLGSLRDGPALEALAINEGGLGCYEVDGQAGVATAQLADMLPPTLRTLAIFRNNLWWHHTDRGPEANALTQNGVTFSFDAMEKKIAEMLRWDREKVPALQEIHLDTPQKFGRNVKALGWTCEQIVGDEMLIRPSIVTDSLMTPEEKRTWEITQDERAAKPSVLLRRD